MAGAVHNALRYSTDLIRGVRRAFGLGGDDDGLERLGETLQLVANPYDQPEWAFHRQEMLYGFGQASGAAAGTQSFSMLRNTVGSNVVLVVEEIWCSEHNGTAQTLLIAPSTQLAGAGARGWARDTRANPGLGVGTGAISTATVLVGTDITGMGTVANRMFVRLPANDMKQLRVPFIIAPGEAVVVFNAAANISINVSWQWRERRAYPGELVP